MNRLENMNDAEAIRGVASIKGPVPTQFAEFSGYLGLLSSVVGGSTAIPAGAFRGFG